MSKIQEVSWFIQDDSFVSIREIQKSPSRALNWFKIILNNGKLQGIYIPQEDLDEYAEDLEALGSERYLHLIQQARSEKTEKAESVRKSLWV